MNTALLRLAIRHADYPGIRLWFCADGTTIAAVPGDYTVTGRSQAMYQRADWNKGTFFGYPTRPGGDERLRNVAREFITHNGCAPRSAVAEHDVDLGINVVALEPERMRRRWQQQVVSTLNTHWALHAAAKDSVSPLVEEKWVRIMCDYSAEGVWAKGGGACGIDDLPVSPWLKARIMQWQARYERKDSGTRMLDWPDGKAFVAEGWAIARAVKAELPDWTVVYSDEAKLDARLSKERALALRCRRAARAAGLSERAALKTMERMTRKWPPRAWEYEVS